MNLMQQGKEYERWCSAFGNSVVLGSGVDWNRCTVDASLLPWKRDGVGILRGVRDLAGASSRGNRAKSFSNSGYSGLALGDATIGFRLDSAWIEKHGDNADELWNHSWYDMAHCTRIDLRFDLLVKGEWDLLGHSIEQGYQYITRTYKRNGKWKKSRYVREGRGETVYIGSRESSHFCRIYNKSAESGWVHPDGDIWRVEWQFNTPLANEVSHELRRRNYNDEQLFVFIAGYCETNGIPVSFGFGGERMDRVRVPGVDTDNSRSLAWLNRSVRGTVRRLTQEGLYDSVEKSLGLLGLDARQDKGLF